MHQRILWLIPIFSNGQFFGHIFCCVFVKVFASYVKEHIKHTSSFLALTISQTCNMNNIIYFLMGQTVILNLVAYLNLDGRSFSALQCDWQCSRNSNDTFDILRESVWWCKLSFVTYHIVHPIWWYMRYSIVMQFWGHTEKFCFLYRSYGV